MVLREWIDVERDGTLRTRMGRGGAAKAGGRVRGTPREVPSRNERGDLAMNSLARFGKRGRGRTRAGFGGRRAPRWSCRPAAATPANSRAPSPSLRASSTGRALPHCRGSLIITRRRFRHACVGGNSSSKKKEGNHLAPPFWAPIWRGPGRRARRGEGARRVPRRVSSLESVAVRTAAEPSLESRSRVAVDAVLAGRHVVGARSTGDIRRSV